MRSGKTDRRRDIVRAAQRCIAEQGYELTTTAQICAAASVSSGTFFHYFPRKAAVLVAILEDDLNRLRQTYETIRVVARTDVWSGLDRWCENVLAEASDPDLAGFAPALGGVPDDPDVAAALVEEDRLTMALLTDLVRTAQQDGSARTDLPPERVAAWLAIIAEGVLARAITGSGTPSPGLGTELADVVSRVVRA